MKEMMELKCDSCGRVEEIDFMDAGARVGKKCVDCNGVPMRRVDYLVWLFVVILIRIGIVKIPEKGEGHIEINTEDLKDEK